MPEVNVAEPTPTGFLTHEGDAPGTPGRSTPAQAKSLLAITQSDVAGLPGALSALQGEIDAEETARATLAGTVGGHTTQLGSLDTRLDDAEADIGDLVAADAALDGRLDTAEATLTAYDGRLDAEEAATISLDGRLDTAEATLVSLDGRLDTAEGDIATLETAVGGLETDVAALDVRLDTAEGTLVSLDGRLDTAEGTISTHTGQISTINTSLAGKQASDPVLDALSALAPVANRVAVFDSGTTAVLHPTSAFGLSLLDDADAAAGRGTLGAAPLASPTFTGTPAAPTATQGNNSTQLATTAYVDTGLGIYKASLVEAGIPLVIDGGGAVITTGNKGFVEVPFNCAVQGWTIVGDASGSLSVAIERATYANFPTFTAISGTEKPTLSSAQKNQDLTLTTWTTTLAKGDILRPVVDGAPATVTLALVSLRVTKT
jgi:hypothetical protein